MGTITSKVSGYKVTFTVYTDPLNDPTTWGVYIYAKTNRGLGVGGDNADYPYFVEKIAGSGFQTHTIERTEIVDDYIAELALSGIGVVDYTLFTVKLPTVSSIIITQDDNTKPFTRTVTVTGNGIIDYQVRKDSITGDILFNRTLTDGLDQFTVDDIPSGSHKWCVYFTPAPDNYTFPCDTFTVCTPKYKCSSSSCISDNCDGTGTYTESSCGNACTSTQHKYKCSDNKCIQDDTNGTYTNSSCDNKCSPPSCPDCDLTKNYCIFDTCIPKDYALYGAIGFFMLMLLKK